MVITDFLERNARLWGSDISLVELSPTEDRDKATKIFLMSLVLSLAYAIIPLNFVIVQGFFSVIILRLMALFINLTTLTN